MRPYHPSRLALFVLERFFSGNEPLAGDLLETSRTRSRAWFWRQVVLAIVGGCAGPTVTRKPITIETALASAAMLVLIAFNAAVGANLLDHLLPRGARERFTGSGSEAFPWYAAILAFVAAAGAGRLIGRLHRGHRLAAVLAFSITAVAAAFLNLRLFVPQASIQPFMPHAALQIVLAMVFAAGLFAGAATRPAPRIAALGVAALLAAASGADVRAQAEHARFEVVSIKRNVDYAQQGTGLSAPQPGGRYIAIGVTLRRLVRDAYGDIEVAGGPSWADSYRFDVNAKAEGNPSPAEIMRMVRPLLAERFHLAVHTEPREMAVYTLGLARSDRKLGATLQESDSGCAAEARNYFPGATGFPPACGDYRLGARALTARGMTMSGLARVLSGRVGRPVVDRSGLDGAFDLQLEWSSDLGLAQAPPGSAGASELSADGLSLFTALQEQLGLRLVPARAAVDVLVIDGAETPMAD